MSLLMTMLSFFLRDNTSMADSFAVGAVPCRASPMGYRSTRSIFAARGFRSGSSPWCTAKKSHHLRARKSFSLLWIGICRSQARGVPAFHFSQKSFLFLTEAVSSTRGFASLVLPCKGDSEHAWNGGKPNCCLYLRIRQQPAQFIATSMLAGLASLPIILGTAAIGRPARVDTDRDRR